MAVATIAEHEFPSFIAKQLGNGEAVCEKVRGYKNMFCINLLFVIVAVRTNAKAAGLQRFEILLVNRFSSDIMMYLQSPYVRTLTPSRRKAFRSFGIEDRMSHIKAYT